MACRYLYADAGLAFRHDGIVESRDEYALVLQPGGEVLRQLGVVEHHGADGRLGGFDVEACGHHPLAEVLDVGDQQVVQFIALGEHPEHLDPGTYDSVESKLAHLAFSIPAVKGIEFGSGFGFADQKGSEANDAFRMQGERIVTATNHNAGLNGGISNGMPVVFRTAVKPTPSIYKTQDTVDYMAKKDAELSIQGRHDPCIVPRAAIVQTCAAALAVGDLLTAKYGMAWMEDPTGYRKEVL